MNWTMRQKEAVDELKPIKLQAVEQSVNMYAEHHVIDLEGNFFCSICVETEPANFAEIIAKLPEMLRELEEKDRLIALLVHNLEANVRMLKGIPTPALEISESMKAIAKAREAMK
jgi:hypothetical protein